jgi:small subunit ribosomal protein S8
VQDMPPDSGPSRGFARRNQVELVAGIIGRAVSGNQRGETIDMSLNDPLADFFTRLRNGVRARHATVEAPSSKLLERIAQILMREGYISDFQVIPDNKQGILRVRLKYLEDKKSALTDIRRVSKPSVRIYVKKHEIRPVRNHLGIAILSTSQGIMTDREARQKGVGGELLCEVW